MDVSDVVETRGSSLYYPGQCRLKRPKRNSNQFNCVLSSAAEDKNPYHTSSNSDLQTNFALFLIFGGEVIFQPTAFFIFKMKKVVNFCLKTKKVSISPSFQILGAVNYVLIYVSLSVCNLALFPTFDAVTQSFCLPK